MKFRTDISNIFSNSTSMKFRTDISNIQFDTIRVALSNQVYTRNAKRLKGLWLLKHS
jgi:hypothetical protein